MIVAEEDGKIAAQIVLGPRNHHSGGEVAGDEVLQCRGIKPSTIRCSRSCSETSSQVSSHPTRPARSVTLKTDLGPKLAAL